MVHGDTPPPGGTLERRSRPFRRVMALEVLGMKVLMLVDMEGASGVTTDRLSWTRCQGSPVSLRSGNSHSAAHGACSDRRPTRDAEAFLERRHTHQEG